MNISEGIKRARKLRNVTQTQLAELSGVSSTAIAHWETGTRDPKGSSLQKLADALGVSVDYLVMRSDDPTPIEVPESPRVLFIEEVMRMSDRDFERIKSYYEFIQNEKSENK